MPDPPEDAAASVAAANGVVPGGGCATTSSLALVSMAVLPLRCLAHGGFGYKIGCKEEIN